jgi:hypothetical protein
MVLKFYPKKDATIYERYPTRNTGLDAILDISKVTVTSGSSATTASYNSRALLDFDYARVAANITDLGLDPTKCTYKLKLYLAEAEEIPVDYDLYCYPLGFSWNMGIGRFGNSPQTTEGVTWQYRTGTTTFWPTSSYAANLTASWNVRPGGGVWYTSSAASQSFTYTTSDVVMDVTSIIRQIQSGSIVDYGFIIKKTDADETSASTFKSIKFFSRDTHTIYQPTLEALIDDSVSIGSGSVIDTDDDIVINCTNLKTAYSEASIPKIRLSARYRYPPQTFATASEYSITYRLPVNTQYAIYDASSDHAFIDFSTFTKISDDLTGNYFNLHLDSLMPERYYKLKLKVYNSGSNTNYQIIDNNWLFKVVRNP